MNSIVEVFTRVKNYFVGKYRDLRQHDKIESMNSELEGLRFLVQGYEAERERFEAKDRELDAFKARHTAQTKAAYDRARELARRLGDATNDKIILQDGINLLSARNTELTKIVSDLQRELEMKHEETSGTSRYPRVYLETFLGLLPSASTIPIPQRDGNNHDHHSFMYKPFREFRRRVCELPWIDKLVCTERIPPRRRPVEYSVLNGGILNLVVSFPEHAFICKVSTTAKTDVQRLLVAEMIRAVYEMHNHSRRGIYR
jgi:hypothetical protein